MKEVVIAGFNRDLSWLSKLSDIKKHLEKLCTLDDRKIGMLYFQSKI